MAQRRIANGEQSPRLGFQRPGQTFNPAGRRQRRQVVTKSSRCSRTRLVRLGENGVGSAGELPKQRRRIDSEMIAQFGPVNRQYRHLRWTAFQGQASAASPSSGVNAPIPVSARRSPTCRRAAAPMSHAPS